MRRGINVILAISHGKNQLACPRKRRPATAAMHTANIYKADQLSPRAVVLWRDREALVNTQYFTAVQRGGTHGWVHPHSLSHPTWLQFMLVSIEMAVCSEGAQSQRGSNRGGQLSARWRFYSCSEESDHFTHVTQRAVAVHRAFSAVKSPFGLQKGFYGITHGN